MTDAQLAATAIGLVIARDDEGLTKLTETFGAVRVIRSLSWFACWILRRRMVNNATPTALREQIRQLVQLMDRSNGSTE